MKRHQSKAAAIARTDSLPNSRMLLLGSGMLLAAGLLASQTLAQDAAIIESHGYTNFGELKYTADFLHLDYVNPDAPKGGEIAIWSQGTFDSFNQYARQGVPAALKPMAMW